MAIQTTLDELIQLKYPAQQLVQQHFSGAYQAIAGAHASKIRGRGIDFEEVRHYQHGDDIRLMDWKVTARTGKPHIKIYREEKERPVFLLIDQSRSMFFGSKQSLKSVLAAKIASLLTWKTLLEHDRLSAIILEENKSQFFSTRRALPLLKALSAIKPLMPRPKKPEILARGFKKLRLVTKPGALIYIISDFLSFNQDTLADLTQLSKHAQLKVCLVRDQFEMTLLPKAILPLTDGKLHRVLNLTHTQNRETIQHSLDEERRSLKKIFQQRRIEYAEFQPNGQTLSELKQWLS